MPVVKEVFYVGTSIRLRVRAVLSAGVVEYGGWRAIVVLQESPAREVIAWIHKICQEEGCSPSTGNDLSTETIVRHYFSSRLQEACKALQ